MKKKTPVSQSVNGKSGFPIVGIGASAGGLKAFEEFFLAMPADSGMAFVLVQHLSPDHESILCELISRYTSMFDTGQPVLNREEMLTRPDGTAVWNLTSKVPLTDSAGHVCGLAGIGLDITEIRKAEEFLKELNRHLEREKTRAEAANRTKSEFLGVMSHELRSPLNGILGFAELLADTALGNEQKDYVRTISSSGEHLLAIVADILDFSSIDAGTLAIHVAPLAVADLMKTAEDTVRKSAADKRLELRCELAAGVPEQITGDEQRIRQILINLLGNAVKFTASGSVVLRVATASEGGRRSLDFCVEDTGIGISSETLSRLFQPFVQGDSKANRRFGGTGLGLAISRRIAEAMGGSITVDSTPGKGSAFTFRLPLESVCTGGMAAVPSHISDREKKETALTEHRSPVQTARLPLPLKEALFSLSRTTGEAGWLPEKCSKPLACGPSSQQMGKKQF
ncbi:MAG: ATP-binding protein [Verrucomicrobiae bacterium]